MDVTKVRSPSIFISEKLQEAEKFLGNIITRIQALFTDFLHGEKPTNPQTQVLQTVVIRQKKTIDEIHREADELEADLEMDEIDYELTGIKPRELTTTNILEDLTLEMPLEIAFNVTEKFVKENGEIGLLKLLEEFEWLANEAPEKLDDLEKMISKYNAQNQDTKELQIMLLAQIDWAREKQENRFV